MHVPSCTQAVQREQWRKEAQAREAVRKEREAARRNMTARKAPVSVVMSEQQRRWALMWQAISAACAA